MTPFAEGQEERIRKAVEERMMAYRGEANDIAFYSTTNNPENAMHVVQIGVSILATKWGIGYPGGSFVKAVVDNDLMQSFGRADHINSNCIRFYVSLLYNQSYVS